MADAGAEDAWDIEAKDASVAKAEDVGSCEVQGM